MAKEFVVAEYGHEERRDLGKGVGHGKNHQINSKTKLSKNEVAVAEIKQEHSEDKCSCIIKIKKQYKEKKQESKRKPSVKALDCKINARKKAKQDEADAISAYEKAERHAYEETLFPSQI